MHSVPAPDKIDDYYKLWREKFNRCKLQIQDACGSLQEVHEYTEKPEVTTPQYISKIAAQEWSRERVFDVYLWRIGSLKRYFRTN